MGLYCSNQVEGKGKLSDIGSANLATTLGPGAILYCAPEDFTEKSNLLKLMYGKLLL